MKKKKLPKAPLPPVRAPRIKTISDVRKFLVRISRMLFLKKLDIETGRALIYAGSVLIKCFEVEKLIELEERLSEVEKSIDYDKVA